MKLLWPSRERGKEGGGGSREKVEGGREGGREGGEREKEQKRDVITGKHNVMDCNTVRGGVIIHTVQLLV